MTNQEINIAIAEKCGWTHLELGPWGGWPFGCPPKRVNCDKFRIPNYCTDLNAMHSVEAGLVGHEMVKYQAVLSDITTKNPHVSCWDLIHATARQRAEAFLRTVGGWRE